MSLDRSQATAIMETAYNFGASLVVSPTCSTVHMVHPGAQSVGAALVGSPQPVCRGRGCGRWRNKPCRDDWREASIRDLAEKDLCRRCLAKLSHFAALGLIRA